MSAQLDAPHQDNPADQSTTQLDAPDTQPTTSPATPNEQLTPHQDTQPTTNLTMSPCMAELWADAYTHMILTGNPSRLRRLM